MRIAFISYEYPPDTAFGGIATYVHHAARMLRRGGHDVDVFCGSLSREGSAREDGIQVHRVRMSAADQMRFFGAQVAPRFRECHGAGGGYDVLESPELNAEACESLALAPALPLVLKLHTPTYLIARHTVPPLKLRQRLRFALGALRRGRAPWLPPNRELPARDAFEKAFAHCADEIAAPSRAIGETVGRDWGLPPERVAILPLPYEPPPSLLALPPGGESARVLFLGRLEPRKGVQHLAAAIPEILRRVPGARFRFVGQVLHSPNHGQAMDDYIRAQVGDRGQETLEFCGAAKPEEINAHLGASAVCVFPSMWESFGYVCLEAMAAGRAIVGSSSGGMSEILGPGPSGLLVPPGNPRDIAQAVIALLTQPQLRRTLGEAARQRVRTNYGYDAILPQQLDGYARAIARRKPAGARPAGAIPRRPAL